MLFRFFLLPLFSPGDVGDERQFAKEEPFSPETHKKRDLEEQVISNNFGVNMENDIKHQIRVCREEPFFPEAHKKRDLAERGVSNNCGVDGVDGGCRWTTLNIGFVVFRGGCWHQPGKGSGISGSCKWKVKVSIRLLLLANGSTAPPPTQSGSTLKPFLMITVRPVESTQSRKRSFLPNHPFRAVANIHP
ncbi:hypothetical protein CDAR_518281 [Caerostris darwini]|uniref:Uncharacterized protein n=1 Tax=Caerostris darwini TaxID=1538125 RepID=A0AAV4RN13_9ARAC|nr:hypothetical protein CDAR_518281 [Caerostris darwini]